MKTTAKLAIVVLGALFVIAMIGCAKKCVTPTEAITPPPPPETLAANPPAPAPAQVEMNLATIHFDFDKYNIRPGDATILQGNYDQIQKAVAGNMKPAITIEGYCDPIGTAEYNMALGMRRAQAGKDYLVKLGADATMFSTISYGKEKLVTTDPAKYEMNRRDEFKVNQ